MKNKWNFFKRNPWIWIVIYLPFVFILYIIVNNYFYEINTITPKVCSETSCFTVELARTPAERQQWLMFRETLDEEYGMLFVFSGAELHSFWMKNTLIPLDIVWIDDNFTVVQVVNAQPCITDPCTIYTPQTWSTYVLEIAAGMASKNDIVKWSVMKFRNIDISSQ